ncbi:MAG: hypothetical protein NTX17_00970 [Candidatus Eisenbacteria bacterium]|nr:hypothetical protein [Candidatus Eisenbacteria bacterium]
MNLLQLAAGVKTSVPAKSVSEEFKKTYGPTTPGSSLQPKKPPLTRRMAKVLRAVWPHVGPYAKLSVFSLAVALVIVAVGGKMLADWRHALIAGYLWDSTLQKITGKP